LYPLSHYDLKDLENVVFCFNWRQLRYTTHEYNIRKGKKMPSEEKIEKQMNIVKEWFFFSKK
jgi:hypothetical protein